MRYKKINYSDESKLAIKSFIDTVARNDTRAAKNYKAEFTKTVNNLLIFPNMGKKHNDKYRRIRYNKHWVFYSLNEADKIIQVHYIRHTSQDDLKD